MTTPLAAILSVMGVLSGCEIVLVADTAELTIQVRKVLEHEGASVLDARTARSGIALAQEIHPHLIICDLGMIGLGGFNFLAELRKIPTLAKVPVLALSVAKDKQGILRAMSLGAADCLLKPFQASVLAQKAEKLASSAAYPPRRFAPGHEPRAALTAPMEIVRASEGGFSIEAPVHLGPETPVRLDSPMLQQLGLGNALTRSGNPVDEGAHPSESGGFVNEINLLGVDPKTSKAIRSFLRGRPMEGTSS